MSEITTLIQTNSSTMSHDILVQGMWMTLFAFGSFMTNSHKLNTREIIMISIQASISVLLYYFVKFKLPIFPSFMKVHFDEIPAFIAGYAYGPFTALIVILVKTIIKLPMSSTLCVGEFADFLFSVAFVLPAAFISKKIRNLKGVWIGFVVSFVAQLVVATVLNVYAILPFYMQVMSQSSPYYDYEHILEACAAANPLVKNLDLDYALFIVLPLNLIKNTAVLIVTFFVYKGIHKALRWEKPVQKEEPEVIDAEAE